MAIIGNGFDLAHGFQTGYRDFVESVSHPSLKKFKSYCDDEAGIDTWYDFENNIRILTDKLFLQTMQEDADYDFERGKTTQLKKVFEDIHLLLAEYLASQTDNKQINKLASVRKYLTGAKAVNFNYTKVAEAYTDDVVYVHGSLAEQDILLGYDYRQEACLAQYDDICWGKDLCREGLAFRRFLHSEQGLTADDPEFARLVSSLATYHTCENSGRGIDEDAESYIPDFRFIDDYVHRHRHINLLPAADYGHISQMVVLGHGIEADKAFLDRIVTACTKLKTVIIFRYHGESDASFEKKADFFRGYGKRVKMVYY